MRASDKAGVVDCAHPVAIGSAGRVVAQPCTPVIAVEVSLVPDM